MQGDLFTRTNDAYQTGIKPDRYLFANKGEWNGIVVVLKVNVAIGTGIPALPVMRLLSIGYIFYFRKRNSMFIKRLGRFPLLWQLGNHVIH
jgi:hypothetical protein